jgi:sterol desaturase/sphingolipid hydroxylase (fatty acid hydroxylase superfamily)
MAMTNLLRAVSGSRANYHASYVIDLACALIAGWLGIRDAEGAAIPMVSFAVGIVVFSFAEYAIHRWLFHGPTGAMRAIHQAHHDGPHDHVALPCLSSAVVGGLAWWALAAALGTVIASFFWCGFMAGYVAYGAVHHLEHSLKISALPFRWMQRRWAVHAVHHRLLGTNFGVTTSFWDRVFGTYYRSARRPPRSTPQRVLRQLSDLRVIRPARRQLDP